MWTSALWFQIYSTEMYFLSDVFALFGSQRVPSDMKICRSWNTGFCNTSLLFRLYSEPQFCCSSILMLWKHNFLCLRCDFFQMCLVSLVWKESPQTWEFEEITNTGLSNTSLLFTSDSTVLEFFCSSPSSNKVLEKPLLKYSAWEERKIWSRLPLILPIIVWLWIHPWSRLARSNLL